MMKSRQKENHVFRIRRSIEGRETKIKIMAARTACNITEYRMIVTPRCLKKDRSFSDRCPGRTDVRCKGDSAFIPDCQRQLLLVHFFFSRGQT